MARFFNIINAVNNTREYFRLRHGLQNRDATGDMLPFLWEWEERRLKFAEWDRLYANGRYDKQSAGGDREIVLKDLLGLDRCSDPLDGWYNPIAPIVDAYQNVLRGQWGLDLWPVDPNDNSVPIDRKSPLYTILSQIWRWSNLDTQKQVMQTWGPLYGTVALRISARDDEDMAQRRARVHVVHPSRIVDFDEDIDGNIQAVRLEYTEIVGPLGEDRKERHVREVLTKETFSVSYDGARPEVTPNLLGVCPFVIVRHQDMGMAWGAPAFLGSERNVDRINYRLSREDQAIDENQFPKWFASSDGEQPEEVNLSGKKLLYSQANGTSGAGATIEPLVADLDHAAVAAFIEERKAELRLRHPELALYDLKALAGQSGETIAKLLKPTVQRIELARANYEHGLRKAMQIATSWAIMLGLVDLGTGAGNAEAADRAYQSGAEDFAFNSRPALPADVYEVQANAKAVTALPSAQAALANARSSLPISDDERLRSAGYSAEQIATIKAERKSDPKTDQNDNAGAQK